MAKQQQQAFQVAQMYSHMDAYVRFVGDDANPEDLLAAASHYATRGNVERAAGLYAKCGQPDVALRLYIQVRCFLFPNPSGSSGFEHNKANESTDVLLLSSSFITSCCVSTLPGTQQYLWVPTCNLVAVFSAVLSIRQQLAQTQLSVTLSADVPGKLAAAPVM